MKTFKVFLFFTKLNSKMSFEYYNANKFHFLRSRFERNFIQQQKDNRSELDIPFPIKDFVSICQGLISFDVKLPLYLKELKIEICFGWNVIMCEKDGGANFIFPGFISGCHSSN